MMLEGKVATVLTTRKLVLNIGARDGVKLGMKFAILEDEPVEVIDPDTNEVLGVVETEKVRVMARDVQQRLTVCSTYQTRTIPGQRGLLDFGLGPFSSTPAQKIPVTLRDEEESYEQPLTEGGSYVKAGDRVREIDD